MPAVIAPSTAGQVQYHVVDQAGNPMSGQPVQIVATGLTPDQATGTTGINGDYVFNYTSPATVGSYTVTANIGGKTDTRPSQVQTTGTVPVVPAGTVDRLGVGVGQSERRAVNLAGSQTNRSEIRALFLGTNNLPIPNVRVRFDLNGDVNSIGGTFTTGSTTLFSDANGMVTTAYVPGARSSPTDGVTVRACYGKSDTDPNLVNCAEFKTVTLTVTSEPLGVTIGTNETGDRQRADLRQEVRHQRRRFGRRRQARRQPRRLARPAELSQGLLHARAQSAVDQERDRGRVPNEDTNRNGVLEAGEDKNGDGQLWPRKPDVIISLLQSKTRADGTAEVQITVRQGSRQLGRCADHGFGIGRVRNRGPSHLSCRRRCRSMRRRLNERLEARRPTSSAPTASRQVALNPN